MCFEDRSGVHMKKNSKGVSLRYAHDHESPWSEVFEQETQTLVPIPSHPVLCGLKRHVILSSSEQSARITQIRSLITVILSSALRRRARHQIHRLVPCLRPPQRGGTRVLVHGRAVGIHQAAEISQLHIRAPTATTVPEEAAYVAQTPSPASCSPLCSLYHRAQHTRWRGSRVPGWRVDV